MRPVAILLMLLASWTSAAVADPKLYSKAELAADSQRYQQRFGFLLEKGLWAFMTPDEQRALRDLVVKHPARGKGVLTVRSLVLDGRPMVRAPLASLKFIEDLSVAYAWRYQNGYSLEPMDEYLAILKHRPEKELPGGRAPDPLSALGVPPKIWERDSQVGDLSLRFRNTAWAFILAHELGHLVLNHTEKRVSPVEQQRQEEEADAFAVDLLSRSDTIPMGMILWFQATAGYMKNRSDFASDAAYLDWVAGDASHPVNGRRMRKLAALLERQAAAARDANRADVLQFISLRLGAIGEIVEDPEMQRWLKQCAESRRVEDLRRLKDQPCS